MNKDNARTTIVLKKIELAKLEKLAEKEDRSLSSLIRRILSDFLEAIKGESK